MKLGSLDEGFFRIFSPSGLCLEMRVHSCAPDETFLRIYAKRERTKKWEIIDVFTRHEFINMLNNRKGWQW